MRPIVDVAADLGLTADDLDLYGRHKAKLSADALAALAERPAGDLVLVTGMTPTTAGEGKTTTAIGLTQALRQRGANAAAALREPSMGPVFGIKGGGTGGGGSQVLPADDINLHFTGDLHAVTAANNLLAAAIDNSIFHGNALGLDPRRITWRRCIDMNDRALRGAVIGMGGTTDGVPREEGFDITPASEVMAILSVASDLDDLHERLGNVIVGYTGGSPIEPVTCRELQVDGAMAVLLQEAIRPNLVQTSEGGPAFVHGGPFANIALGCNSIAATRASMAAADITVTEAGFGSDLGAEKFFNVYSRDRRIRAAGRRDRRHRPRDQAPRRTRRPRSGDRGLGRARSRPAQPRRPHRQRPQARRHADRRRQPLPLRHRGRTRRDRRPLRSARRPSRRRQPLRGRRGLPRARRPSPGRASARSGPTSSASTTLTNR